MKSNRIIKIMAVLLIILMIVPVIVTTVSAKESGGSSNGAESKMETPKNSKTSEPNSLRQYANNVSSKVKSSLVTEHGNPTKAYKSINQATEVINDLYALDQDVSFENIVSLIGNVSMFCGPYGQAISAACSFIQAGYSIAEANMGGVPARSEVLDVEDRLTQQFDEVKSQLWDIEREVNSLSDDINASTSAIIASNKNEFKNAEAKEQLSNFMISSGKYDFSYDQYRNYIYGSTSVNVSTANTAYYSLLKESVYNGASEEEILYRYDQLYTALMDNRDAFRSYVMGSATVKSIIEYYYDAVSYNSEFLEDGMTAEEMTVLFAYDIYQTEYMSNQLILACHIKYLQCMLESGSDVYTTSTGIQITKTDILGAVGIPTMADQIIARNDEFEARIAEALIYTFGLEDYYVIELKDGTLYEVSKDSSDVYGYINSDACKRVYFGTVPEWACDVVGIDPESFTTKTQYSNSAMQNIDGGLKQLRVSFCFKDETLASLTVDVNDSVGSMGGNGSPEHPYLISTADQFRTIASKLDKHFVLICDIDFNDTEMLPIGTLINGDGTYSYETFTGSLDGQGYKIKNLNITGGEYTGIFAISAGEITNLKLHNIKAVATLNDAKKEESKFYAGTVAGRNYGVIKYCMIDSDATTTTITMNDKDYEAPDYGVIFKIVNYSYDRSLHVYSGGIVGDNSGIISCCEISNIRVDAWLEHHFAGQSPKNNRGHIYVGGICAENYNDGQIKYCRVNSTVQLFGEMHLIADAKENIKVRGAFYMGGICALAGELGNIYNIESHLTLNDNVHGFLLSRNDSSYGSSNEKINGLRSTILPNREGVSALKYNGNVDLMELINAQLTERDVEVDFGDTVNDDHEYYAGKTVTHTLNCVADSEDVIQFCNVNLGYTLYLYKNGSGCIRDSQTVVEFYYIENVDGTISIIGGDLYKLNISEINCDVENKTASIEVYNIFNSKNITVKIGGKQVDYEIVEVYNFNVQNSSFTDDPLDVCILFSVKLPDEDEILYFSRTLQVNIGPNSIESCEIVGLNRFYTPGSFSLAGLKIGYTYEVGEYEERNIDISRAVLTGDINSYGENTLKLTYDGNDIIFTINVVCANNKNHNKDASNPDSGYVLVHTTPPTCTEPGVQIYVCGTDGCGHEKQYSIPKLDHVALDQLVNKKPATCQNEGYTGDVVCACGEVLIMGTEIPVHAHVLVYTDEGGHHCGCDDPDYCDCDFTDSHHYTVTESVELVEGDDGSVSYRKVYYKTCICQNGDGVYWKSIVNENELPPENDNMPTVVVTNGYALNRGDEVVIYIRLENNPGLLGADFGIIYDEGLELKRECVKDGNIFEGSMVSEAVAVNHGYNFLWANSSSNVRSVDGTLLELTFKILENSTADTFYVKVVYNTDETPNDVMFNRGFALSGVNGGNILKIPTIAGCIKLVDQLPGDVNSDGVVDLLDAIEIAKYLTTQGEYHVDEKLANVDLSISENGYNNVDIYDVIAILNHITGSAGEALVTQDFSIILNYNGADIPDGSIDVSIYGENNTYSSLPTPTMPGYKFIGWSYDIDGGEIIDPTARVTYNRNQLSQTLYAQWEINSISFNSTTSGATHGSMDTIYYRYNGTIKVTLEKKYGVEFKYGLFNEYSSKRWLAYSIIGWVDQYGNSYASIEEAVSNMKSTDTGRIVLSPVWSDTPTLDYPDAGATGYTYSWKNEYDENITPGVNDEEMIVSAGLDFYVIKASYDAVNISIRFDGNGAGAPEVPAGERIYSAISPYDLSAVVFDYPGYKLVSWNAVVNGNVVKTNIAPDDKISYIEGVGIGDVVTFVAQWQVKTYKLNFSYAGGYLVSGSNSIEFSAETNMLSLPKVSYLTYPEYNRFMHWCTNEKCGVYSENCDNRLTIDWLMTRIEQDKDVTVYAVWDVCQVYNVITQSSIDISSNRAIIDFNNYSLNGKAITITLQDVSEVHIIGKAGAVYQNVEIVIRSTKSTTKSLTITMQDVCLESSMIKASVSGMSLKLSPIGANNKIIAPSTNEAIKGIATLTLNGPGSLYIKGGSGVNGSNGYGISMGVAAEGAGYEAGYRAEDGGNGGDGYMAISSSTYVTIHGGSYEIYGGNGGNGGNGGSVIGTGDFTGNSDLPDGGHGGDGGDGALPLNETRLTITGGNVILAYGDGGNGGHGGDGGNAANISSSQPDGLGHGGNGGNGGAGFNGGNGGSGGNGGFSYDSSSKSNKSGSSGCAGNAGNGGDSMVAANYTN